MEGLIFGGIVTLFLGFIVLAIVLSIRADKKRAEAMALRAQAPKQEAEVASLKTIALESAVKLC